jgi:hypothetical protein
MQGRSENDRYLREGRDESCSSNSEESSSEGSDEEVQELEPKQPIEAKWEVDQKRCNVMIPEESEEDSEEESEEKDSSKSSLDDIKPTVTKPNIQVKRQTKKQEKENYVKNENKPKTPIKGVMERPKTAAVHDNQLKASRPQTSNRIILY